MALLTPTSHTPPCSLKRSDGLLLYLFTATFANIYNGKFSILLCCLSICFLLQHIYIFPVKRKVQMRTFCSVKTFSVFIFPPKCVPETTVLLKSDILRAFWISDIHTEILDSKNLDKLFSCRQICRLPLWPKIRRKNCSYCSIWRAFLILGIWIRFL